MGHCNANDLEWSEDDHGETAFRRKRLGEQAGGQRLGCSLYELPPGKRSWPYHYHAGNEEAIYVLAGEGAVRLADGRQPLVAGDYLALPAGEDGAHRVYNDGDEPLRYLVLSTMREPDVTVYPDAEAFGVYAGSAPGSENKRTLEGFYRRGEAIDYWAGIDGAEPREDS